jgi:8-hydroxy-5-deazaflavin:NADPH oxidoreductase
MKKIGILGSGQVAKVLAAGFLKHGYEVMMGTRDAAKLNDWLAENKAEVGSFEDAAQFGEIVVLAVKGNAANSALALAGIENLEDKLVIDTTNPIGDVPPSNGVLNYFTTLDDSLMEQLQRQAPQAHFVKAWNSVGNGLMVNPDFNGTTPTMFICGNNEEAKSQTTRILAQFGWETQDCGKAEGARAIEPLCMLWCIPGFLQNQWMHAFKLLKK